MGDLSSLGSFLFGETEEETQLRLTGTVPCWICGVPVRPYSGTLTGVHETCLVRRSDCEAKDRLGSDVCHYGHKRRP